MELSRLITANIDGRTQNTRYRQSQFHRLQNALGKYAAEIQDAIRTDTGHTIQEVRAEVILALQELRTHYGTLDVEKDLETEYLIAQGKDSLNAPTGVGIVYIVPCSHTLFFSAISGLTAALAAGNCVVLELPQTTGSVSKLLRQLLTAALDHDTFTIVTSRPDASFLKKTKMVIQDGSEAPLTYNLISPSKERTIAIVDRSAKVAEAAQALVAARFALGGRSPYSPDIVLVNEFVMKPFLESAIQHASRYLSGENGESRRIPSSRSKGLLGSLQKDRSVHVLVSGADWGIIDVHDRSSHLLQSKIEEKILLVHPITSLDDAIDINGSQTLAAVYAFAAPASAKYLTQFIDADISWVNHVPMHMLIGPAIPRNAPYNNSTRYSLTQLQKPRTQLIQSSKEAHVAQTVLENPDPIKSTALWQEALAPLPSTNQRPGFRIGFFEQGIITGGLITLGSLIATVSTLGYYTWVLVRARL